MLRPALRSAVLSIPFLFLSAAVAVPCLAVSRDFDHVYPLHAGGSFELQNVNGPVEVQGWDRDEVEIHAVKTAKEKASDLDLVSIEVSALPDSVSVATHYPDNQGVEVAVEYTVHVPHGARVQHIGTVNGTLRVSGVEDLQDVHAVNGGIEVYGCGGGVYAHTTNGNVHIELAHFCDEKGATAETTNGSIFLAIPADTEADIEARSLNGNFSSELPISLASTLRPRETRGKLGKGGAPIRLRTVNGAIRVAILRSTI